MHRQSEAARARFADVATTPEGELRVERLAAAVAVVAVYLLTDVRLDAEPVGLIFAGANALMFAAYIIRATGSHGTGSCRRSTVWRWPW